MQNLFRRPSGIYVLRIVIPAQLRRVFGKREVVLSTGTRELTIAKMVAGTSAAQWRQRFFDAGRLMSLSSTSSMHHQEILKIAQGHPVLLGGGHLTLPHASLASGISSTDLLRTAASGGLSLFVRLGNTQGELLPIDALDLVDSELGRVGGYEMPWKNQKVAGKLAHIAHGVLRIPAMDLPGITAALLTSEEPVELVALELAERPGLIFTPTDLVCAGRESIEVAASEVEALRKSFAATILPDQLLEAKELQKTSLHAATTKVGKKSNERLSTALDAYITNRVRQDVASEGEITRIKNGCALLIELEGDLPLAEIDTDKLRNFRTMKLSRVPANENKIRLIHGSKTVTESMKAVEGTDWPVMSVSERNKRMRWIGAWFRWLHEEDKWIAENPAASLHGQSVLNAAERRKLKTTRRDDEAREAFNDDDLRAIFSATWFKTGRGELSKKGTYRTFSPFYYWLPLLGLFTGGGRINELSQLHLNDIKRSPDGTWYVDINDEADDQTLKTKPSKRQVPLHPTLLALGFDKWHAALVAAGYRRMFPELIRDREKGYGKAPSKWFTNYMARLGIPRDGRKTFHSFRHTYTNALPEDMPDRIRKQLTGHSRGKDVHDKTYRKDVTPDIAAPYVKLLAVSLPQIATFDIDSGLKAIRDALQRKNRGRGAEEYVAGD